MGLASGVNVVHRVEVVSDLGPVRVAIAHHVNRKLRHKVVTLNPVQVLCRHSVYNTFMSDNTKEKNVLINYRSSVDV